MSKLQERLTRQLASRGVKGAKNVALGLLKKRGHVNEDGSLTPEGSKRQALGNDGRAKDRAAKATKASDKPSDFKYDPRTNKAKKKK